MFLIPANLTLFEGFHGKKDLSTRKRVNCRKPLSFIHSLLNAFLDGHRRKILRQPVYLLGTPLMWRRTPIVVLYLPFEFIFSANEPPRKVGSFKE